MSTELPEFNKGKQPIKKKVSWSLTNHRAEWTPWVPHHHVLRIIGLISGRVFIGPALNRTNEYLDSTVGYSISALQATDFLLKYPKILRPIIQYFVPALYEAEKHRATLKRVLKPVLEQRLAAEAAGEKPVADLLTWYGPSVIIVTPLADANMDLLVAGTITTRPGRTVLVLNLP